MRDGKRPAAPTSTSKASVTNRLLGALTDELRAPPWRGLPDPLAGHCYVASEALFHLTGGYERWRVERVSMNDEGVTHWYLRERDTGEVVDLTASQFAGGVPYEDGVGTGFLTPHPSARARTVMDRVTGVRNG